MASLTSPDYGAFLRGTRTRFGLPEHGRYDAGTFGQDAHLTLAQPAITVTSRTPDRVASGADAYAGLIANDPLWKQTQADLSAQGVANAAQRAAAIQRALVQYGQVPDLNGLQLDPASLGYLKSDVNDLTRKLADQNTQAGLSLVARLADQHTRAQTGITDDLAARGIFRSGALPSQVAHEGLAYKQAGSDARNAVLDAINGVITNYVTQQTQIQSELRQALADAAERARQAAGATDPNAPPTTPPPGGTGSQGVSVPPKKRRATAFQIGRVQ